MVATLWRSRRVGGKDSFWEKTAAGGMRSGQSTVAARRQPFISGPLDAQRPNSPPSSVCISGAVDESDRSRSAPRDVRINRACAPVCLSGLPRIIL